MKETKPSKVILSEETARITSIYYIGVLEIMEAVVEEKERLKNKKK